MNKSIPIPSNRRNAGVELIITEGFWLQHSGEIHFCINRLLKNLDDVRESSRYS